MGQMNSITEREENSDDYGITKVIENIASKEKIVSAFSLKYFHPPFSKACDAFSKASDKSSDAFSKASDAFSMLSAAISLLCVTFALGKAVDVFHKIVRRPPLLPDPAPAPAQIEEHVLPEIAEELFLPANGDDNTNGNT